MIELLITISVIAILAALLFPVGQKMLGAGRATKCVAQLSQLAAVFTLYQNDRRYYVPAGFNYGTDGGVGKAWYEDGSPLCDYMEGNPGKIAICPEAQIKGAGLKSLTGEYKPGLPYCCNYNVMILTRDTVGNEPPSLPLPKFGCHRPSSIARLICYNPKTTDWGPGVNENNSDRVGAPHNKKGNVLWLDGHVTSEDTPKLPDRNWSFNGANYN